MESLVGIFGLEYLLKKMIFLNQFVQNIYFKLDLK